MFFQEIEGLIDREYIEYVYEGRFKYELFLERMVSILHECIESPALEDTCDDSDTFIEDETDYSYEIEEMLDRIGIKKYDGLTIVNKEFDCTYIEALAQTDVCGQTKFIRCPVNVLATVWIHPKEDTN
jgi:hypothetical protein